MRKLLITLIVTAFLPSFAFGQEEDSSDKTKDAPRVIITDPELDPYGPLDSTGPQTETISIGTDEEKKPDEKTDETTE